MTHFVGSKNPMSPSIITTLLANSEDAIFELWSFMQSLFGEIWSSCIEICSKIPDLNKAFVAAYTVCL